MKKNNVKILERLFLIEELKELVDNLEIKEDCKVCEYNFSVLKSLINKKFNEVWK